MKALSIQQPWAWAIVKRDKRVENRTWPTTYRGPVLIHASQACQDSSIEACAKILGVQPAAMLQEMVRDPQGLAAGAVVGVARLVDCVERSESRWFFGPFGFVLENVRPLNPFPIRGRLGLFDLDERAMAPETAAQLRMWF